MSQARQYITDEHGERTAVVLPGRVPKWTEAFLTAIQSVTGKNKLTYITAVTIAHDEHNKSQWDDNPKFRAALCGNPLPIVTLHEMLTNVFSKLGTSVESSQFSRTLQLIKAAGMSVTMKFATK